MSSTLSSAWKSAFAAFSYGPCESAKPHWYTPTLMSLWREEAGEQLLIPYRVHLYSMEVSDKKKSS